MVFALAVLCAFLCGGASGCSNMSAQNKAELMGVAAQAPGVVQGLVAVAESAPVDAATKAQISNYGQWAIATTDAACGVASAMTKEDGVSQALGCVKAVNDLVQSAPFSGSSTASSVASWASWATVALEAAKIVLPVVL